MLDRQAWSSSEGWCPWQVQTLSISVYQQSPVLTATAASIAGIVEELRAYHAAFADCFPQRHQQHWLEVYLRGLLVAEVPRKNVEAVALRLLGAGEAADREVRALQHFVSEGSGMTRRCCAGTGGWWRAVWGTRRAC